MKGPVRFRPNDATHPAFGAALREADRAADDQADGRLAFRAAPAAAGGPAQLLGAAALGIG